MPIAVRHAKLAASRFDVSQPQGKVMTLSLKPMEYGSTGRERDLTGG